MLTGRAVDHGISDYDVFYFDPDTSWQAEDAVIRDVRARLTHLGAVACVHVLTEPTAPPRT